MKITPEFQILLSKKGPVDAKSTVGAAYSPYSDVEAMPDVYKSHGQLIYDVPKGVHWEVIADGTGFSKRIFDGVIHVKALCEGSLYPFGVLSTTIDGVSLTTDDAVLVVGDFPQLNGIYLIGGGDGVYDDYRRHPAFDKPTDDLSNVIFIVDEGTKWKNSQWIFTNKGDITVTEDYQNAEGDTILWDYWYGVVGENYGLMCSDVIYNSGSPGGMHPIYGLDFLGTGISDTHLNFELVNSQAYNSNLISSEYGLISKFDRINYVDTSSNNVQIITNNAAEIGTTLLSVNMEYLVQKISSDTNYVSFGVVDYTSNSLPEKVIYKKDDWIKFSLYQNPSDVTDISTFSTSNRNTYIINLGSYSSDGLITDTIPAGYDVFGFSGFITNNASSPSDLGYIGIGTTTDASDILDPTTTVFSDTNTVNECFGNYTPSSASDTPIYIKANDGWTSDLSDVTLQMCIFEYN